MIFCIQYKSVTSLQCESKCETLEYCFDQKICCTLNICAISFHCESISGSSEIQLDWMICCTVHTCEVSPRCEWVDVSSDFQLDWTICCNLNMRESLFTPLCIRKCFLRLAAWVNDLLHSLHLYSFSPLCLCKCLLRCPAWLNDWLHCAHLCNFSPVYQNMEGQMAETCKILVAHGARMFGDHVQDQNWPLLLLDNNWGSPHRVILCPLSLFLQWPFPE